jgi:hypothetical protein
MELLDVNPAFLPPLRKSRERGSSRLSRIRIYPFADPLEVGQDHKIKNWSFIKLQLQYASKRLLRLAQSRHYYLTTKAHPSPDIDREKQSDLPGSESPPHGWPVVVPSNGFPVVADDPACQFPVMTGWVEEGFADQEEALGNSEMGQISFSH